MKEKKYINLSNRIEKNKELDRKRHATNERIRIHCRLMGRTLENGVTRWTAPPPGFSDWR